MEVNDYQNNIYSKLHQISKNLNETNTANELFNVFSSFTTQDLNFQKCLIFKHDDKNGWFRIVSSQGYETKAEKQIVQIVNLLLSGEIIEYLRIHGKAIIHTPNNIDKKVEKLCKTLFLNECYFELIGGTVDIPFGLIVVGNSKDDENKYSKIKENSVLMIALSNLSVQISNAINNIVFYNAWNDEKKDLENKIKIRTKEINEQKVLFETMYYGSKDAIGIIDMDSNFLSVNPEYCELTNFSEEELLKLSCLKLTSPKYIESTKSAMQEVIEKGYVKNFVKDCIINHDNIITIDMSMSMLYNPTRILISVRDITKDIIFKKKLIKANEQITLSNNTKKKFIANMSHEIRTPMNGIIGMSSLAMKTKSNEKRKVYISKISSSANSLLDIINDILDFSKLDANKMEIESISFNLNDLVQSVVDMFEYKIEEKNLYLDIKYGDKIKDILYGDPLRIKQILINILNNAIKFTKNGGITIDIIRISNKRYSFELKDTGIGISKDKIDIIFEPFSQADSNTTREFGGTGLGLTIVKKLVNLMNGKISVNSVLNKGSAFRFDLEIFENNNSQENNNLINKNENFYKYIDYEYGLRNHNGNENQYKYTLNNFVLTYENSNFDINENKEELKTILDISDNIGAFILFHTSKLLIENYSNNNLNKFQLQLNNLIDELNRIIFSDKKPFNLKDVNNLFESLKNEVLLYTPKECRVILNEINSYALSDEYENLYKSVNILLKKYKFNEIHNLLKGI